MLLLHENSMWLLDICIVFQEELAILRRKAERMKKMEQAGSSMDEVLLEEIREYKETLTCPSCKVNIINYVYFLYE